MGAGGAEVGVADPASLASRLVARVHAMGGYAVARVLAGAASVEGAEMGAELGAEMGTKLGAEMGAENGGGDLLKEFQIAA